jgi:hypothetical protein
MGVAACARLAPRLAWGRRRGRSVRWGRCLTPRRRAHQLGGCECRRRPLTAAGATAVAQARGAGAPASRRDGPRSTYKSGRGGLACVGQNTTELADIPRDEIITALDEQLQHSQPEAVRELFGRARVTACPSVLEVSDGAACDAHPGTKLVGEAPAMLMRSRRSAQWRSSRPECSSSSKTAARAGASRWSARVRAITARRPIQPRRSSAVASPAPVAVKRWA